MCNKKMVYEIILTVWNIAKEHCEKKMSDDDWQKYMDATEEASKKFKQLGVDEWMLYRHLITAFTDYLEKKQKEVPV